MLIVSHTRAEESLMLVALVYIEVRHMVGRAFDSSVSVSSSKDTMHLIEFVVASSGTYSLLESIRVMTSDHN